jgi:hypothetical protein
MEQAIDNEIPEEIRPMSQYTPDPKDSIDIQLAIELNQYMRTNGELPIRFSKSGKYYKFGKLSPILIVSNNKLMLRVGGGYNTLEEYLNNNLPKEIESMKNTNVYKQYQAKLNRVEIEKENKRLSLSPLKN